MYRYAVIIYDKTERKTPPGAALRSYIAERYKDVEWYYTTKGTKLVAFISNTRLTAEDFNNWPWWESGYNLLTVYCHDKNSGDYILATISPPQYKEDIFQDPNPSHMFWHLAVQEKSAAFYAVGWSDYNAHVQRIVL
jgi:hypothetical protein